jgi:hypothetical protein
MTGPTQNQSNSEYGFLEGWAPDQFRSKQKSLLSQDENSRLGTIAVALEHRWSQNRVRTAIFRRHQVQGPRLLGCWKQLLLLIPKSAKVLATDKTRQR